MNIWEFLKWAIEHHPIITIILFFIIFSSAVNAFGSMFESGDKK